MAGDLELKTVAKHLANGSLGDSLCVVCLLPLSGDDFENIFTSICKKEDEYCIADVLRQVCQLKILNTEHYNICCNCFNSASAAYQFYLQAKRSYEILNFYTDQLSSNIQDLDITLEDSKRLLCIPLPVYTPETQTFEYGLEGIGKRKIGDDEKFSDTVKDEDVIVVVEDGKAVSYRFLNGELEEIESEASDDENVLMIVNEKQRKKRDPMTYTSCMHCSVKYRFLSKLKEHVKRMHNVDIYYCKICKEITDSRERYEEHLTTHIGEYQCTQCNAVYRREESLIAHMECHDNYHKYLQDTVENGNICEVCGVILEDEESLEKHHLERHVKRFTCYYCGRSYKGRQSFELHIQKHENYLNNDQQKKPDAKLKGKDKVETSQSRGKEKSKRCICGVCDKSFVDERSLLWHQRLHDNERPFTCDICSRGFVSVNRRNQHVVCAHARPSRRCPLCPALFHLRSMVNTHVKKVHLNKEKRRNRTVKQTNVFWKTTTVPIQELSVSIQNEVLEIQSSLDKYSENDSTKKPQADSIFCNPRKRKSPSTSYTQQHLYTIDMNEDLPSDPMSQNQEFLDETRESL